MHTSICLSAKQISTVWANGLALDSVTVKPSI